ncbi:MAG: hypothetical protein RLY31_438 [Bacteroidota bacterium]
MVLHSFLLGCLVSAYASFGQSSPEPRVPFSAQQEILRGELAAFDLMRHRFSVALEENDMGSATEIREALATQLRDGISHLRNAWILTTPTTAPPSLDDWPLLLEEFLQIPLSAASEDLPADAPDPEKMLDLFRSQWSDAIESRPGH